MKTYLKNLINGERGFTLIEMMIVLVIISILLLIAVPNLAKNQSAANDLGCEATIEMIKAQKIAYEIETGNKVTDLNVLLEASYVDTLKCPNEEGDLTIDDLKFKTRENVN